MWPQVKKDLCAMLGGRIYPILLTDAVYRQFLKNAGLGPNFPPDNKIPSTNLKQFQESAELRARIVVAEIAKSGGIEPAGSSAKLLKGPLTLYRFGESRSPERREGVWWFEKQVVDMAKREAGKDADARSQWLRERLAVCMDWSAMDRIDWIELGAIDLLPAVQGIGRPQRMYSAAAIPSGRAQSKDYWPNLGKSFPGGLKQTVLPFIPRTQGKDLRSFISQG